jgi:hypothetical protein
MAIIKTKFDRGVEGATNIVDGGTEGTKVASGTTAQRGSTAGQFRFNSTTGLAEYYNGSSFTAIEGTPSITSISPNNIDTDSNALPQNITITGNNFQSGATVTFIDSAGVSVNSTSVTFTNSTTLVAQVPNSVNIAQQPLDVKVNNPTGLSATLTDGLQLRASPTWTTNSGSLGNTGDKSNANLSVVATDPDGGSITYSETTSNVLSGAGLTLNTSTGAITGTPNDVSGDTTINFTIRATDNESATTDRNFSITIQKENDGSSSDRAFVKISDADNYNAGTYYIKTSSSTTAQLYFYKINGYAYCTVGCRYKSTSTQTSVNTNSAVGSANSGTSTFSLGTTVIRYLLDVTHNTDVLGMIMIPQQANGALSINPVRGNLFKNSNTDRSIPTDIFTNNHESDSNKEMILFDLSNTNPNTGYPSTGSSNWDMLDTNTHEGGNQILSIFRDNNNTSEFDGNETTGDPPYGVRWSNNNGHGYHGGATMNDITGSARNLTQSEPITLFLLAR